jgi:hypothetical protein
MPQSNRLSIFTRLLLVLTLAFIPMLTHAKPSNSYEGEVQSAKVYCQPLSEKASPLVAKICIRQVKVKYKLSLLMGEPVGSYHVYWEIDPKLYLRSGVTLDGMTKTGADTSTVLTPGGVSIDTQSPAVQKAFAALKPIYPTRFVMNANAWQQGSNRGVYFMFDGGNLNPSGGDYSYNTPGSPGWDSFMLDKDYYQDYKASKPLPYLPAEQAKQLYPHLQAAFEFDRILNLIFSGVSALNSALRSEVLYPLTVNVVGPAGGSQVAILNSQSAYKPGMLLKAGRYQIRVTHPGFKPVEKWISLNAKHTTFSIQLNPAADKQQPATAEKTDKAAVDELEAMLSEIESPSDSHDDDNPFAEANPASNMAVSPPVSLEETLAEIGRQDSERLQQAKAKPRLDALRKIKNEYDRALRKCNTNKPVRPADYVCNTFHLTSCGRNQSQKECRRQSELWKERKLRECARERAKVEREQKTFPQRLEAWKRQNQQCQAKALADYNAAIKTLEKKEKEIDDFASEVH